LTFTHAIKLISFTFHLSTNYYIRAQTVNR
jgi:hypothetical protein